MLAIRLANREWMYDPDAPLGPKGGFGAVFLGHGEGHGEVAVKRLHVDANDAAHREMRLAEKLASRSLAYVIPVLDSGRDAESDSYFIVMPRADYSLQDTLNRGTKYSEQEAVEILRQIARALEEVNDIVHRDLKPGNVLWHGGAWKVADFGIARFVEEATSSETLKGCLSPQYAAPEQWEALRATTSSDLYALGGIAHALITGRPPFSGPGLDALREQHLQSSPPELPQVSPRFQGLMSQLLRKNAGARPSLARVLQILDDLASRPAGSASSNNVLAEIGAKAARLEATEEAQRRAYQSMLSERNALASEAYQILRSLVSSLFARVRRDAPTARLQPRGSTQVLLLGEASIEVDIPGDARAFPPGAWTRSGWDVLVGATIGVKQMKPRYDWFSCLWYARLKGKEEYRWYEVSYMDFPLSKEQRQWAPFALNAAEADIAAASGMQRYQIAFGPKPIDDEDSAAFQDRWIDLLARAYKGEVRYPSRLPLE